MASGLTSPVSPGFSKKSFAAIVTAAQRNNLGYDTKVSNAFKVSDWCEGLLSSFTGCLPVRGC